jgi:hypothetical protein
VESTTFSGLESKIFTRWSQNEQAVHLFHTQT